MAAKRSSIPDPRVGLSAPRPTARGSNTRERILAAAARLFAERGYHGASIADIQEAAEIQRGALYYHIASKEELLFEVLRQHTDLNLAGAREIAAEQAPADAKLRKLIAFQAESLLARRDAAAVYDRDRTALTGARAATLRDLQHRIEAIWAQILAEGVATGAFQPVDRTVLKGIITMVNGIQRWYRPGGRLDSAAVIDHLTAFVLDGLAAHRA